jgi:hypothetical protein
VSGNSSSEEFITLRLNHGRKPPGHTASHGQRTCVSGLTPAFVSPAARPGGQGRLRLTETVCWNVGRFWKGVGGTEIAEVMIERFWS